MPLPLFKNSQPSGRDDHPSSGVTGADNKTAKRIAVISALQHPNGAKLSDRQIAEHVGVHNDTVSRYRCENAPIRLGLTEKPIRDNGGRKNWNLVPDSEYKRCFRRAVTLVTVDAP